MSVGGEDWRRTLLVTAVLCYKTPASGAAHFLPNGDIPHARLCLLTALKPAQGNKLGQHRLTRIASYIALYSALGKQALGGRGHNWLPRSLPGSCQGAYLSFLDRRRFPWELGV